MKTETKLFKYVQKDNFRNVKTLLVPTKRKMSITDIKLGSRDDFNLIEKAERDAESLLDVDNIETVSHVNINCQDPETGYTPLMWAVLNGNMDMASLLLHFNSSVNITDYKGNTALHLAAFSGRSDIVELILNRGADVNVSNHDGNTPLHIACQNCATDNKFILLKLLRANPDATKANKDGASPMDLAAQYGRIEALSMLLDHEPQLRGSTRAFVEAAIRGHARVLELMLDYGIDPNVVDQSLQTTALHEACRYLRYEAADVLLSYGADPSWMNSKNEMPKTILATYPGEKVDEFLKLFQDWERKVKVRPRYVEDNKKDDSGCEVTFDDAFNKELKYPVLKSDVRWSCTHPSYCSSWTHDAPNTGLLDSNRRSPWRILGSPSGWVVFDFQRPFIISGVKIWGWDSDQMPRLCKLQRSCSLSGPWQDVLEFQCVRKGSTVIDDAAECQDFYGFEVTSPCWRLYIKDNHGGDNTSFHAVEFYGVDSLVIQFFTSSNLLERWKNSFLQLGYNKIEDIVNMRRDALGSIVGDMATEDQIWKEIQSFRREAFPFNYICWLTPPVERAYVGATTPAFVVQGDAKCEETLHLIVKGDGESDGPSDVQLVPHGHDRPALAVFSGINFTKEGDYVITVKSLRYPEILISSRIIVAPEPSRQDDLDATFAELEKLLMF